VDAGLGNAAIGVNVASGNQVSNRLASLRDGTALSGLNTGDGTYTRNIWVEGFGGTTKQDDKDGAKGYDANNYGMSFGVDTDELVQDATVGAAFTYAMGTVDSNASSNASTDINTYIGTLYGSKTYDNGLFANAQASVGTGAYESERTVIGVGKAKGEFDGLQASLKGEVGKDFAMDALTLTPMAGLQYNYLDLDKYTETGAGGANLTVKSKSMSTVDASVGGKATYTLPLESGGTLKPNVHANYVYRMGDDTLATTSNFTGGGASFATTGVKSDRSSVNLGTGLLLTTASGVDLSAEYNADLRSSLTGHTGQLKARLAF
jgi:outer membrane autotransporter protein